MKRNSSSSLTARATVGALLLIATVVMVLLALFTPTLRSANPASGTIASPTALPLAWVGTAPGTGAANGESSCQTVMGIEVNCDTFTLTVGGTPADWATAGKRIEVKTVASTGADDYDLVIHKTSNSGPIVDSSGNGPGGLSGNEVEVAHINPATDGVGVFTVHVIYFATTPPN
jgi:hypothetical protein